MCDILARRAPRARLPLGVADPGDDQRPNGDQPIWAFGETSPKQRAKIQIARSQHRASNLLLPVVGVPVSTGLPPCPGLRGEPCRDYRRYKNRAVVRMR
jgi:hypothetical protein